LDVPGFGGLLAQSAGKRIVGSKQNKKHTPVAAQSRPDAEPALPEYAKVSGKLVPVAVGDLLHDLNLRVSVGPRHAQQKDPSMGLLRVEDQLAKVGIHGEDNSLLIMGEG
jgi:hypothetical protein